MSTEVKLSNAVKIFIMKHPSFIGKPSLKQLKKDGLLDNIDFTEEDVLEFPELEELYSSEEEITLESF